MLKREYLERMGYKYLKNGIYEKIWYGKRIILNSNNNSGYVENDNIYFQKDIDLLQIALNVLNSDLEELKKFKEDKDLYELFKTHSDKVLVKRLRSFKLLLKMGITNENIKKHIKVVERLIKERNINEGLY